MTSWLAADERAAGRGEVEERCVREPLERLRQKPHGLDHALVVVVRTATTAGPTDPSAWAELKELISRPDSRLAAVEAIPDMAPDTAPAEPSASPLQPSSVDRPESYILNRDTGSIHRSVVPMDALPQLQKTVCGWPFATRNYTRLADIPFGIHFANICPRCCSHERELCKSNGDQVSDAD